MSTTNIASTLDEVFSGYNAQWLEDNLYAMFAHPSYFGALTTNLPCVLMGGRGTGKTTVLRALSFEGQLAIRRLKEAQLDELPYIGLYHRVDMRRMNVFQGDELSERGWTAVFSHYVNLWLLDSLVGFLSRAATAAPDRYRLPAASFSRIAEALQLTDPPRTITELSVHIDTALLRLENHVHSIGSKQSIPLTPLGRPVEVLVEELRKHTALAARPLMFILDEYESLLEYQQICFNTLIKYSSTLFTFKIGVREFGWRTRATMYDSELEQPADFMRIEIEQVLQGKFGSFAEDICTKRFAALADRLKLAPPTLTRLFRSLSYEEEAELQGISGRMDEIVRSLRSVQDRQWAAERSDLELYFAWFWADSHDLPLTKIVASAREGPVRWRRRYLNYRYAMLFTLNRGRGQAGIRKYYTGWRTFTQLAGNNTRYLVQLVHAALGLHVAAGGNLQTPISPRLQTEAAKTVGELRTQELVGKRDGRRLRNLLFGLARVFQVMAARPERRTPELNQFRLDSATPFRSEDALALLRHATGELVFRRFQATKLSFDDFFDHDYMIHPIFSAFWSISYRRKRTMTLSPQRVLDVAEAPRLGIERLLRNRHLSDAEVAVPEQLALFEPQLQIDEH